MSSSSSASGALADKQPSDEEVVPRILEGDVASFEVIMRRYNQRLFRVVRSILSCEQDVEDVLQETYARAFEHLGQFAGRAKFSTWLTKIAVHAAMAHRRRLSRWRLVENKNLEVKAAIHAHDTALAEQQASNQELRELLIQAIDGLPSDLRSVFVLRDVEGASTHDCAACLDLSEANVKVRLHRARAMLRERIDAEIGEEVRQLFEFGRQRCHRLVQAVLATLTGNSTVNS